MTMIDNEESKAKQEKHLEETFSTSGSREDEQSSEAGDGGGGAPPTSSETQEEEVTTTEEETSEEVTEEDIGNLFGGDIVEEVSESAETGEEDETPSTEESEAPVDLFELSDEEYEEVITSRKHFADYIKRVQKASEKKIATQFREELDRAKEDFLKSVPELVQKSATRASTIKQITSEFFQNNPFLAERKPYVRDMVSRVSSDNPEMGAKEVLDEVAKRARRDFGAYEKATKRENERSNRPVFAGSGGRRSPSGGSDNRSKQQKLLDETFN